MTEVNNSAPSAGARQFGEAKDRFLRFLKDNNLRQTPERFAVLEEVYSGSGHFDADELHMRLKIKGGRVSRATVYNTLDLLQDADLVIRHQFGQNQAKYEPAFSYRQHDHLICTDCGEVFEFCDPRIQGIQEMVGEIFRFHIQSHSLHVYGSCNRPECPNRTKRGDE